MENYRLIDSTVEETVDIIGCKVFAHTEHTDWSITRLALTQITTNVLVIVDITQDHRYRIITQNLGIINWNLLFWDKGSQPDILHIFCSKSLPLYVDVVLSMILPGSPTEVGFIGKNGII